MKVTVVLWFPDWSSRHFRVIERNSSTAEYQCLLLPSFWNIVNLKSSVKLWLPIVPLGILPVIHVCYTDVGRHGGVMIAHAVLWHRVFLWSWPTQIVLVSTQVYKMGTTKLSTKKYIYLYCTAINQYPVKAVVEIILIASNVAETLICSSSYETCYPT